MSRRFTGQMESIVQGIAQRAIELVVETLDVNALLARIDLNAMLMRVEWQWDCVHHADDHGA